MLKCHAKRGPGHVEVSIELTNETSGPLWVAASLPRQVGSSVRADPLAADVYADEAGQAVIARRLFEIPLDVQVEQPEEPQWARLPPGERYVGRTVVSWPLTRRVPYAPAGDVGLGEPQELVCEVGVVPADAEAPPRYGPDVLARQRLLRRTVVVTQ